MRIKIVLVLVVCIVAGCKKPISIAPTDKTACGYEVIFSLANQDRTAPVALTDVLIDGISVFHGALGASQQGNYIYVSTRVPNQKIKLEARSEAQDGEIISAEKNIWVEDKLWIVITRLKEYDALPEVRIEISYENPWPLKTEK